MKKIAYPVTILLFILVLTNVMASGDRPGCRNKKGFTILTYNVRNCKGLDNITDYRRVAEVINRIRPSIVALQELDSATLRSNGIVVLDELAALQECIRFTDPQSIFRGVNMVLGY
jgi:endonuclease/exonuclease/phosphatase family metal-dependent hydrolase